MLDLESGGIPTTILILKYKFGVSVLVFPNKDESFVCVDRRPVDGKARLGISNTDVG